MLGIVCIVMFWGGYEMGMNVRLFDFFIVDVMYLYVVFMFLCCFYLLRKMFSWCWFFEEFVVSSLLVFI